MKEAARRARLPLPTSVDGHTWRCGAVAVVVDGHGRLLGVSVRPRFGEGLLFECAGLSERVRVQVTLSRSSWQRLVDRATRHARTVDAEAEDVIVRKLRGA
jgi:hypothetical protein